MYKERIKKLALDFDEKKTYTRPKLSCTVATDGHSFKLTPPLPIFLCHPASNSLFWPNIILLLAQSSGGIAKRE